MGGGGRKGLLRRRSWGVGWGGVGRKALSRVCVEERGNGGGGVCMVEK